MSVDGRRWVVLSLSLGVFLGSVALTGCLAESESDPEVLEQEEVEDVDSALEEGVAVPGPDGTHVSVDTSDVVEGETTDHVPGDERQEPEPHPWYVPADPKIDDGDPEGTPI